MITPVRWTGHEATLLRTALRMSMRTFAAHLGVAERTISKWEKAGSRTTPWPDTQAILNTALDQAGDEAKARFTQLLDDTPAVTIPDGAASSLMASHPLASVGNGNHMADGSPSVLTTDEQEHIARSVMRLGMRMHLADAKITELAKLAGHLVDLQMECSIDIAADGWALVTYSHQVINLTSRPVKRMTREQWFETTSGTLKIKPHPSSDRRVHIQRIHDTPNMSKFACHFSPAIEPGEVATIAYTSQGGRFIHDHYWRQSVPRYTRYFTLSIRHREVSMLLNCTAIEEQIDGSEASVIEDLACSDEDGDALITLSRGHLQPGQAVTVRWEVSRATA